MQDDASQRTLRVSASALGKEGDVLRTQLARFQAHHPQIRVEQHPTPDAADLRHQLYVQWLNAGSAQPDVLQLDVIWTPEFAAAGWILPLDRFSPDTSEFFPRTIEANRWNGALFALPWFADVGMLYYRTDLVARAPATFDELLAEAARAQREREIEAGFVWQGARYEGLVTTFLEHLGGTGGRILDDQGRVVIDSPQGAAALHVMQRELADGVTPPAVLSYHEEEARLAFQNGRAVFMRNWPYAYALVDDASDSKVAGRVGIAPMPAEPGGRPTAALGGSQLAINANSWHPELAYELVAYLTAPEQMRERVQVAGQYPTRPALYDDPQMPELLRAPAADVRRIVEAAEPRPVTPVYTELSERLQVELHRALTGQKSAAAALGDAANGMREVIAEARLGAVMSESDSQPRASALPLTILALVTCAVIIFVVIRRPPATRVHHAGFESDEARLAWIFVLPALLTIALIAVFPLLWTLWESLHHHDLRLPWTGRPFVGVENYAEAFSDPRFRAALGHTAVFTVGAVTLELVFGLILALALNRAYRGRGVVRAAVLIPWAIPTVVAALVWNFMFQPVGITNQMLQSVGVIDEPLVWFNRAVTAWVPVIVADVWKTTPFVALLLLAGLQNIDDSLLEAASVDGASAWQQLWRVTLPLLKPTIGVALLFRVLDAFRVFDLIYVMTGGGPGTSTEPIAFYTFNTLLQNLRFGYGSALSMLIFLGAFGLAMIFIRVMGADLMQGRGR
jgi:ABC-type sugar transport system permease subunit/ABC-type glycerol-3-phosphate transport system substrate-binding protein